MPRLAMAVFEVRFARRDCTLCVGVLVCAAVQQHLGANAQSGFGWMCLLPLLRLGAGDRNRGE